MGNWLANKSYKQMQSDCHDLLSIEGRIPMCVDSGQVQYLHSVEST